MKCIDCNYRWQEVGDLFPTCHYIGMDGTAPCEIEGWEEEEGEEWDETLYDDFSAFDEEGFDPYTGCWTGDC